MEAAVLHYRTDLPRHELIVALTKFSDFVLTGSNAQHQIENLPPLIFNCYADKNVAVMTSMSSVTRRYMSELVASFMEGVGLQPQAEPRPVVKQFPRLYAEADPEDQFALRVWMRDIILGRKEGSVNMLHARRSEKRMIEAYERRILEFPIEMGAREVALLDQILDTAIGITDTGAPP